MYRILSIFLSFILVFPFMSVGVNASDENLILEFGGKKDFVNYNDTEIEKYVNEIDSYTVYENDEYVKVLEYYSEIDDATYCVKVFLDKIEIYNTESNLLVSSATIEKNFDEDYKLKSQMIDFPERNDVSQSSSSYERWGSYVYIYRDSLKYWLKLINYHV